MALGQYQLLVNPEEMHGAAANFSKDMTDMSDVIQRIGDLMADIANNWTGGAFSLFESRYNDLVAKLKTEATKPIQDAVNDILQATSVFEEAEASIGAATGGLSEVNPYTV